MTTTPFRLFDLPFVAKRIVFDYFKPIEIFEISFTSSRVRKSELKLMKLQAIEYNIRFESTPVIETVIRKDNILGNKILEIHLCNSQFDDPDENDERVIGCHRLKIRNKFPELQLCHHNAEFAVSIVFDYIFSIFRGPVNISMYLCTLNNVTAVLLNPHFAMCEKLEINEDYEHVADESDIEQVLDLVSVSKTVDIYIPLPSGIEVNKLENLKSLILYDAKWMSLQDLCFLKCEDIRLVEHTFDIDRFQQYAEWWLNSNNTTLKTLMLTWDDFDEEIELDTQKLPWKPWNPQQRSRYFHLPKRKYCLFKMDCIDGLDVTRSDGLTATCLIPHFFEKTLMFLVWHDPFPEKQRIIELNHQISKGMNRFYTIYNSVSKDKVHGKLGKDVAEILEGNANEACLYPYLECSLIMYGDEICSIYLNILQQVSKNMRELAIWENS